MPPRIPDLTNKSFNRLTSSLGRISQYKSQGRSPAEDAKKARETVSNNAISQARKTYLPGSGFAAQATAVEREQFGAGLSRTDSPGSRLGTVLPQQSTSGLGSALRPAEVSGLAQNPGSIINKLPVGAEKFGIPSYGYNPPPGPDAERGSQGAGRWAGSAVRTREESMGPKEEFGMWTQPGADNSYAGAISESVKPAWVDQGVLGDSKQQQLSALGRGVSNSVQAAAPTQMQNAFANVGVQKEEEQSVDVDRESQRLQAAYDDAVKKHGSSSKAAMMALAALRFHKNGISTNAPSSGASSGASSGEVGVSKSGLVGVDPITDTATVGAGAATAGESIASAFGYGPGDYVSYKKSKELEEKMTPKPTTITTQDMSDYERAKAEYEDWVKTNGTNDPIAKKMKADLDAKYPGLSGEIEASTQAAEKKTVEDDYQDFWGFMQDNNRNDSDPRSDTGSTWRAQDAEGNWVFNPQRPDTWTERDKAWLRSEGFDPEEAAVHLPRIAAESFLRGNENGVSGFDDYDKQVQEGAISLLTGGYVIQEDGTVVDSQGRDAGFSMREFMEAMAAVVDGKVDAEDIYGPLGNAVRNAISKTERDLAGTGVSGDPTSAANSGAGDSENSALDDFIAETEQKRQSGEYYLDSEAKVKAMREERAVDTARNLRAAMAGAARSGMSPEQMTGFTAQLTQEADSMGRLQEEQVRLQTEVINMQSDLTLLNQAFQAQMYKAQTADNEEARNQAFAQAMSMQALQGEQQRRIAEMQSEISALDIALGIGATVASAVGTVFSFGAASPLLGASIAGLGTLGAGVAKAATSSGGAPTKVQTGPGAYDFKWDYRS